ncbi:MAG: hypothetical protein JSW20_13720 [Nitrospiraceae bacterium]|nr:MAG: hypothetical protein JSW20_13720 [Nitrospiraceae bacterium]
MKIANVILFPVLLTVAFIHIIDTMPASAQAININIPADSCMTAKCHGELLDQKFLHGPVSSGECTSCHGKSPDHKDNPVKNTFKPIENASQSCYSCHEQFQTKEYTHTPVEEGECTVCHDPHGSPNKFQLISRGRDLCFNCHDENIVLGKYIHGPAVVGGCVACHDPHTADYANNLRADGPDLCYTCHTEKKSAITNAAHIHTPVTEDCTSCHNPHSAPEQFMLTSESPTLCLDCHDDQKKQINKALVKHGALEMEGSCLNCHDAHISNVAKNLTMEPMDLCISCHDRIYKSDGRNITNMKKLLAENMDHHGPIKQKDCSGCHNPHGSDNFRILRSPYPPTFYMPFAAENYSLCFNCHEMTLVLEAETTKLTNFRNGEQNLHFTHVNKPEKGRTCRSCHETHGSNYPKHIREAVPFGSWDLPVEFLKTDTGGSCTTGCHQEKKYDRVNREMNGRDRTS